MSTLSLPIDSYLDSIVASLGLHKNLVLTAAPGAGKTTRLPAHLAALGHRVIMLEPRRLAARAAAERIALERGWKVGNEVGYQVRFENRTSRTTRLQILTEGVFTRRLQSNPELEGFGVLILDEFHERSSNTDIALAFARELQDLSRPDLHIIVMSATLNTAAVSSFLGEAPVIEVPGLTFPVDVQLSREPQLLVTNEPFLARAYEQVRAVIEGSVPARGDVLVFLPGVGEIERLGSRLEPLGARVGFDVFSLHGSLSLIDQDLVLRPSARRKVILSTNIAETSLTIPGVGTVIDTGLARVMRQEGMNFPKLTLSRISRFSAIQRAGRAGRDGPGFAYRLWTRLDESSMAESETPELLRTDAADVVLLLSAQGVTDPDSFTWFEKPPASALSAASLLLRDVLDAIDSRGAVTDMGRRLLEWPLPVRLARVMEESVELGCIDLAARVAALLSERDVGISNDRLARWAQLDSDIGARLEIWDEASRSPQFANVKRTAEQLRAIAERKSGGGSTQRGPGRRPVDDADLIARLLLSGFSDRLAKRRGVSDRGLMQNGGARVAPASLVKRSSLFFCLEAVTGRGDSVSARSEMMITKAAPLDENVLISWLAAGGQSARISAKTQTLVDRETRQVMTETFRAFDELPLEEPKRRGATVAEAASVLPDLVFASWERLLTEHPAAKHWLERLDFLRREIPDGTGDGEDWPLIDESFRRAVADELAMGAEKLEAVLKKDPVAYFEMRLSRAQRSVFASEAPERLTVPSGFTVEVHYPSDRAPYVECRLQELFGWMQAPLLARGRVALVVHVLGPNYRPVQVTADLRSFWSSSYQDVRKELRARYPKHDWPEDPFTAKPSSKGRRRT